MNFFKILIFQHITIGVLFFANRPYSSTRRLVNNPEITACAKGILSKGVKNIIEILV